MIRIRDDDDERRVHELYIPAHFDVLPRSILRLDALEKLNVLTSHVPRWIGELKSLKEICLQDAEYLSEIPEGIWDLTNLQVFKHYGSCASLSGSIANFSNLKRASCYRCESAG